VQLVRNFDHPALLVGWGVNVTLLTDGTERGRKIGAAIRGYGATVEMQADVASANRDAALIVVDCDALGGIDQGHAALRRLNVAAGPIGAILISSNVTAPEFPQNPSEPVILRGPVSLVALRVGFEHALRAQRI
jgi:hypothetical protein